MTHTKKTSKTSALWSFANLAIQSSVSSIKIIIIETIPDMLSMKLSVKTKKNGVSVTTSFFP